LLKLSFLRHRGPRVGEGGLSVHCAASLQHVYPWTVVCTSHALNFSFFGIQWVHGRGSKTACRPTASFACERLRPASCAV